MSKGKKRQKAIAAKNARKAEHMKKSGGKSKYAQKYARAVRGHFSPTSPFFVPPEQRP